MTSAWFPLAPRTAKAPVRLFCFPFAGGGASVFRGWERDLPPGVDVFAAQYPGHETRLAEAPFRELAPLLESLDGAIAPLLDRPFAFFGHSMGAVVAFELARKLRRENRAQPKHLFVSARRAPHLRPWRPSVHDKPDEELVAELRRIAATDPAVFEHPELMQLLLPIVRADFRLVETHQHVEEAPLAIPITAFAGKSDAVVRVDELAAWREHTSGAFALHEIEGDHLFVRHERAALLSAMGREL
ncbi:MAG TPA: alpha/beta fold hydrolase [Thermoanaerobaculia bacterium]|nr:alpha/beta fold hydrolase [Thermoanaerobaculia bacterium]